jgi:hypothetical protein
MNTKLLFRAGIAVVLTRLTLASIVVAQIADAEPPATRVPPRFEIGPTAGLTVAFPEFGVVASAPIDQRGAIEVVVSRMPAMWEGPARSFIQLQVRAAFRDHLRSRKSFLLGLTRIAALRGDDGFLGTERTAFVRPHAGVSLQWPVAPTLDFRFDAQGIFTFAGDLPLVPRAMTAFVWHPRTRR